VHIDKPGRYIQSARVNCAGSFSVDITNGHDSITPNGHIGDDARFAAAIEYRAAADHKIVIGWLRFTTTARKSDND
jgi:hypothetical protein